MAHIPFGLHVGSGGAHSLAGFSVHGSAQGKVGQGPRRPTKSVSTRFEPTEYLRPAGGAGGGPGAREVGQLQHALGSSAIPAEGGACGEPPRSSNLRAPPS